MKGHDYTLCLLCEKWDNNNKWRKVNDNRLGKKTQLLKLLKTFSCHTTYAHVV
jgi:hypothetical protein